jgi:hypothetical protein
MERRRAPKIDCTESDRTSDVRDCSREPMSGFTATSEIHNIYLNRGNTNES